MKNWCLKDKKSGNIFKVFLTEKMLKEYLNNNPDLIECINCVECDDAPSIMIE
jgi:hypothetical protein